MLSAGKVDTLYTYLIRLLLFVVPAAFLILYLFSFLWPEARILDEAANDLFQLTQSGSVSIPMHRYAIVQNKILPWILFNVHAPFKAVVYGYLVNDLLLYLTFFCAALWKKEYLLAAFFLLTNLLAWKLNYFVMSSELFLTLPWLFLWGALMRRDRVHPVIPGLIMLVVFFSHPLCVLIFLGLNFLFGYEKKVPKGSLILFTFLFLTKLWLLTGYDTEKLSQALNPDLRGARPPFIRYLIEYVREYFLLIFLAIFWMLNRFITTWRKIVFALGWVAMFMLCYNRAFSTLHVEFTKWLLPVHFAGIYAFYIALTENTVTKKWLIPGSGLVILTLFIDLHTWYGGFRTLNEYTGRLHCLIDLTRQKGLAKTYIIREEFDYIPDKSYQQENIILTQFPVAGTPVQTLVISKERETLLLQLDTNSLYFGNDFFHSQKLKPPFEIAPSRYHKFIPEECECFAARRRSNK